MLYHKNGEANKCQNQITKISLAYLQFVLCGLVIYRKCAKFLCQPKALPNIFRGHKIHRNLDTRLQKGKHILWVLTWSAF